MTVFFSDAATARVRLHPDTPVAYVRWSEILPLLNHRWATEIGNRLGWSLAAAQKPVGSSHEVLRGWLGGESNLSDGFMLSLMKTPVIDFIDAQLPFLMNLAELSDPERTRWLQAFNRWDAPGRKPFLWNSRRAATSPA